MAWGCQHLCKFCTEHQATDRLFLELVKGPFGQTFWTNPFFEGAGNYTRWGVGSNRGAKAQGQSVGNLDCVSTQAVRWYVGCSMSEGQALSVRRKSEGPTPQAPFPAEAPGASTSGSTRLGQAPPEALSEAPRDPQAPRKAPRKALFGALFGTFWPFFGNFWFWAPGPRRSGVRASSGNPWNLFWDLRSCEQGSPASLGTVPPLAHQQPLAKAPHRGLQEQWFRVGCF